uniref:NAC domain-containing protein n=1 Tax=Nymphaea colorata TaxID=210225 RepID=A0A5K1AWV9_9MAGN
MDDWVLCRIYKKKNNAGQQQEKQPEGSCSETPTIMGYNGGSLMPETRISQSPQTSYSNYHEQQQHHHHQPQQQQPFYLESVSNFGDNNMVAEWAADILQSW